MTNLEIIIESFQGLLAQACLFALLVVAGLYTINKFLELLRPSLSKLWRESRMGLAALALLSVAMGLWADKTDGNYGIVELCNYGNEGMDTYQRACRADHDGGYARRLYTLFQLFPIELVDKEYGV